MKILAVDTSTKHMSLAINNGDVTLVSRNSRPRKDLSLSITFDIERILQRANVRLTDLEGFVVGLGPGSFTGLRVGLSMLKAFVMVTGKPVVGVSSLDAIAMNVRLSRLRSPLQVCVINDARRSLVYSSLYDKNPDGLVRRRPYQLEPLEKVLEGLEGEVVFIGDATPLYKDAIMLKAETFKPVFEPEKRWLPKAAELGKMGYQRLLKGESDKIDELAPLYLYPEDCQVGGPKGSHDKGKAK
ncbi:MAG: tRNA (adenosine(37)-N6)-threonylcarbamoyltransferase complex dimerization subunit type 1 TsaB [Candidatus Omnitrophica bacterium]|nr:tRNA (adenosine(37)-N6)-threonylcarbamoyltransferase complex dimerization subunit type 1 TsaB [Candidatus Omnitrophota bacterium]